MSFQNLVRLSQIKKKSLPDYAHVNKVSKKFELLLKKLQLMSYNMMIGYDIYDRFTMEHLQLRQNIILTTSFFCSRQYYRVKNKLLPRIYGDSLLGCHKFG
jgi:hypothetical protein